MPALLSAKNLSVSAVSVLLCFFVCLINTAAAVDLPDDPKTISWHLSAMVVTYDEKRDLFIAEENVVITGGKTRLEADYVEFSNTTKDALAQGNVRLIAGGDVISCNAMQINLATQTGFIHKGTIFIQKNHFYIHGENIRKTGRVTYTAAKGSITSCDGDTPDWKITGKNVKVTIEGYGSASHATLWAKNMPALYAPFLTFPVKTKRQTGFLTPRVSSSDRLGYVYEQPFFWAISPSTDATLYAGYLSNRGPKITGEYRYLSDTRSKGLWRLDFFPDDKTDDGTDATENYRFNTTPLRTETDRYWLRMKTDQALPNGFYAKLDLDIVSDADYLLEFKDGPTGYDDTNQMFQDQFGRDLDEYDDTVRKNSLIVDRTWSQHFLAGKAFWYDDVIARRGSTPDTTLQTLPGLEFDAVRQQIGTTDTYYAFHSQLTSFFRQDTVNTPAATRADAKVNGQRLDLNPRFFYPMKLGKALAFQPFIGLRATAYHTDSFVDTSGDDDSFRFRTMVDLGGDLSTRLNRIFTVNSGFAEKIQHQVTPAVGYRFLPRVDQKDLPFFDTLDDIKEENRLTWSLLNRFTARKTVAGPGKTVENRYHELGWIKLYQDYDIKNERDGDDADGRPWSDINLEARIFPFSFLSLNTELAWSPYSYDFSTFNIDATVTDKRGDAVTTAYRYTEDTAEYWYTRFKAQITPALSAYYSFELDLARDDTIETRTGIILKEACWAMGLEFKASDLDRRIALMITLKGIGDFSIQ
ncbi:MAG TPA: LPS assembly protein LptD [Desulfotignum sp.]|nr:LPS assembly protein LptD [Desulfotignum sp.]